MKLPLVIRAPPTLSPSLHAALVLSANTTDVDPPSPVAVFPFFHPGFQNSQVTVSMDAEKAVFSYDSCGGCARAFKIRVFTRGKSAGLSYRFDKGYMEAETGSWMPGSRTGFGEYQLVNDIVVLDAGVEHYLHGDWEASKDALAELGIEPFLERVQVRAPDVLEAGLALRGVREGLPRAPQGSPKVPWGGNSPLIFSEGEGGIWGVNVKNMRGD